MIKRADALRDMNLRCRPDGGRNTFALRFVTLKGEAVSMAHCYQLGAKNAARQHGLRRRNIQECTADGRPIGHPVSVSIDLITWYNGEEVEI